MPFLVTVGFVASWFAGLGSATVFLAGCERGSPWMIAAGLGGCAASLAAFLLVDNHQRGRRS